MVPALVVLGLVRRIAILEFETPEVPEQVALQVATVQILEVSGKLGFCDRLFHRLSLNILCCSDQNSQPYQSLSSALIWDPGS